MKLNDFNLVQQLKWSPVIENGPLPSVKNYILCGMGGSALAGGLLNVCSPDTNLAVHRDYGLPRILDAISSDTLAIISSFSGNTEETLDAYRVARERRLPTVVLTSGGQLLEMSRRDRVPTIVIPVVEGLEPRFTVGYFLRALALITRNENLLVDLEKVAPSLDEQSTIATVGAISGWFSNRLPIFYSSLRYIPLTYFWKIIFNETVKIPAFSNVVPEANHNELEGFGPDFKDNFSIVLLTSDDDHHQVVRRFAVMSEMLSDKGFEVNSLSLVGETAMAKVINSVYLAVAVALSLAEKRGVDPVSTPTISDFKQRLKKIK